MERSFDVVVVGGGHAGSEAALAAARMGCSVCLLTLSLDTIGQMSCNPAIGGLGKGQLVKELDALGGEMGVAIDDTGIQFRTLNSSKGPAVRSSRAQADRDLYRERIQRAIFNQAGLTVIAGAAAGLEMAGVRVVGVRLEDGSVVKTRAVVITTGTFLRGLMHTGEAQTPGGRVDEKPSVALSLWLEALGLRMGRMKTGTPPRLRRSTIDYTNLVEQPGDVPILPFSFRTQQIDRPQVSCWLTTTTKTTHEIIGENVHRSPMFNGQIQSRGPRYCPSIEDKISRFADKESHHIFLEPEGFESDIVYPNGISTSLPADVQNAFVRSIPGLERVEILRIGYAVEYDHVDPTELDHSLKLKSLEGVFLAGQINGTSGYEEAGAQGIVAGINAALSVSGREPFVLGRDESYIGVMIDDLVTLGVTEPYRMFTSRAEFRLSLREDNAVYRLSAKGHAVGVVSDELFRAVNESSSRISATKGSLEASFIRPTAETNSWLETRRSATLADGISLAGLLRRPEISIADLSELGLDLSALSEFERRVVETEVKFEGYLRRQAHDIERLQKLESLPIPPEFSFRSISGLSMEVRDRLTQVRPATLGHAGRVSGVTPAALALLAIHLRRPPAVGSDRD